MSQAWEAYAFAFPATVTGFVFATVGWLLSYGVLLLLGTLSSTRSRAAA
jgi:ascorbate-specific PTS system EIIC-type component UlaA